MQGLHLTADLHNCRCDSAWLLHAAQLGSACRSATLAAGLQVVNEVFHSFPASTHGPGGVTATLLLAPNGTRTLATAFWAYSSEIDYAGASPYALLMVLFSLPLTWLLYIQSKKTAGQ